LFGVALDVPSVAMTQSFCRCDMEGRGCGLLSLHPAHRADAAGFPQALSNAEVEGASSEHVDVETSSKSSFVRLVRLEGCFLVLEGLDGQIRRVLLLLAEVSRIRGPSDAQPLLLLRVPSAAGPQILLGAGALDATAESATPVVVPVLPNVARPSGPRKRPGPSAWIVQRPQRRDRWLFEVGKCSLPEHRSKVMQELLAAIGGAGAILRGIPLAGEARPIGAGTYAEVVSADLSAAFGSELGRNLVAKVPHSHIPGSERSFRREIEVLAAVQGHPGTVRMFGVFVHGDRESDQQDAQASPVGRDWCLALEYCAGGSLAENISKSTLPEKSAKAILYGVLDALLHLHRKEFVHRDVKPDNVLLRDNGEPVLADFGLAFHKSEKQEGSRRCGSIGFAAPELILGSKYGEPIDVWSSGVLLFAMLCGDLPFIGADDRSTLRRTVRDPVKFHKHIVFSEVTPFCKELIYDMLQKDPAFRPTVEGCLKSSLFDVESSPADDIFTSSFDCSTASSLPALVARDRPSPPLVKSLSDTERVVERPHPSARDSGALLIPLRSVSRPAALEPREGLKAECQASFGDDVCEPARCSGSSSLRQPWHMQCRLNDDFADSFEGQQFDVNGLLDRALEACGSTK